jgi:hypothetical protein
MQREMSIDLRVAEVASRIALSNEPSLLEKKRKTRAEERIRRESFQRKEEECEERGTTLPKWIVVELVRPSRKGPERKREKEREEEQRERYGRSIGKEKSIEQHEPR